MRERIVVFEGHVNRFLRDNDVVLQQHEFDALVSFTWQFWNTPWVNNWNIARLVRGEAPFDRDLAGRAFGLVHPGYFVQSRVRRGGYEYRMFFYGDWRQ